MAKSKTIDLNAMLVIIEVKEMEVFGDYYEREECFDFIQLDNFDVIEGGVTHIAVLKHDEKEAREFVEKCNKIASEIYED